MHLLHIQEGRSPLAGQANIMVATDQEHFGAHTHTHARVYTLMLPSVVLEGVARKISISVYYYFFFNPPLYDRFNSLPPLLLILTFQCLPQTLLTSALIGKLGDMLAGMHR